jgi:protein-L-isoaspartate(D-aspartate) O-methyltransferase
MDSNVARFNMVEQQIRTWDVLDGAVLNSLLEVKREDFVPAQHQDLAFVDMAIPLGDGEFMWEPKLEARAVQEVMAKSSDRVLDIGTGSGYLAALLAARCAQVLTVDCNKAHLAQAKKNFATADIRNIETKLVNAEEIANGLFAHEGSSDAVGAQKTGISGLFDIIVLGGSVPVAPSAFFQHLYPGGRVFAIVGQAPAMQAILYQVDQKGGVISTVLFETVVPPLIGVAQPSRFKL